MTFGLDPNPQDIAVGEVESSIALNRSAGTADMDGLTSYMLKAIWKAIPWSCLNTEREYCGLKQKQRKTAL